MFKKKKNDLVIYINGMMCKHCEQHIKEALNDLEGVCADVDLKNGCAYVNLSEPVEDSVFIAAIENAGYKVKEIKRSNQPE
jgi:Cu2+-exporting ATPase/Cu+-exporting ATPase